MKIRVGFEEVEPRDLGFENYYTMRLTDHSYKPVYLHYLERHNEPLVFVSFNEEVYISDFNKAETRYYDYPTLPFRRMLKILESQQERFLEEVAFALKEKTLICCSALNYVRDLAALIEFSLARRAVFVNIDFECQWPKLTEEMIRKIEDAIADAEKPAPSLGNLIYVEIAERAWHLLRAAVKMLELVPVKTGCTCNCSDNCNDRSAEMILF